MYVNYPNDRSIMSAMWAYENGGAFTLNETDVTKLQLQVNSNTILRENTPRSFREIMRSLIGGDWASGCYYQSHRRQPIETAVYATVQEIFTLGAVNAGTTKIRSLYESVYPSGKPLTGISPNG